MNQRDTLTINAAGHLTIGGADTVELAKKFGTPLYVMDEKYVRDMCSAYRTAIEEDYAGNGLVLYASKAFSCTAIYRIVAAERIGVDVVSGGELYMALKAGFPADKIYMHGNNKLPAELSMAVENGVGCIVVDSFAEIDALEAICERAGTVQRILIRVNPGVEAHTHHFIQTAKTDSKFGFSLADGTAEKITLYALQKQHLRMEGYHCHIGSQIFEKESFCLAADKMLAFMAEMKSQHSFEASVLNLGGGYGIWYAEGDAQYTVADYSLYLKTVIAEVKKKAAEYGLKEPYLLIEPGRSIVGEAGITLYTVGTIKEIPGVKNMSRWTAVCSITRATRCTRRSILPFWQTVRRKSRAKLFRLRGSAAKAATSSARTCRCRGRKREIFWRCSRRGLTTIRWRAITTATSCLPWFWCGTARRIILLSRSRTKI